MFVWRVVVLHAEVKTRLDRFEPNVFGQTVAVNYRNALNLHIILVAIHIWLRECVPIKPKKKWSSLTHLLVAQEQKILCICTKPSRRCRCHSNCFVYTYIVSLLKYFQWSFLLFHFILRRFISFWNAREIEREREKLLFYFCFGCWANTTKYLLDRHGNYAPSRCRVFWFVHKLCIVNVNKSMAWVYVRTLKNAEKKKKTIFSIFFLHSRYAHQVLACLTNELNFINKSV